MATDVTACIPTRDRPDDVARTVQSLLRGTIVPRAILISEASPDEADRFRTKRTVESLGKAVHLLSPPLCGNRSGNRNWLADHVTTSHVLFLDDDVDVAPEFLGDAVARLRAGAVSVVVAAARDTEGSGWLTFRGHFRRARPSDPVAVAFQVSLWDTALFRSLRLDEAIEYGFEDAEISMRLHRGTTARVHQSEYSFVDRGLGRTAGLTAEERAAWSDTARCYVSLKRYSYSRLKALTFVAAELAANLGKRRRPLPRGQVQHQWRDTARFLLGGPRPAWSRPGPLVGSHATP